jgi:hypothetical protein
LFLERVNDAFRPVLGGDDIGAAALVTSGPPPYPLIWLSAAGAIPLSALVTVLGASGTLNLRNGAHRDSSRGWVSA